MSDDITLPTPSKSEALDFTDRFREAFDTFCDSAEEVAKFLKVSLEIDYWKGAEYDSWKEWYETEYSDHISFLKDIKLGIDTRADIIQSLADGGLSKIEIAATVGVSAKTVHRTLTLTDVDHGTNVPRSSSDDHVSAGQSVEPVVHIDDDDFPSQIHDDQSPTVIEKSEVSDDDNDESEEDRKARLDSWLDTINFDAMVIPVPKQIIEAEPSNDTPEYFQPRPLNPRPLEVIKPELPPRRTRAYDEAPAEFLEPAMKLEKVQDPNKDDSKHCRTCNCGLLP